MCTFLVLTVRKEFADNGERENFRSQHLLDINGNPVNTDFDEEPHGTAVAAMAAGKTLGVAKKAKVIGVKFRSNRKSTRVSVLVESWYWIVNDVRARGRQGRAVIVMSLSKPPLRTLQRFR